jgi:hypothetical protein
MITRISKTRIVGCLKNMRPGKVGVAGASPNR